MKLDDPVSAMVALDMAIKRCGDKPEFKTLKDRASLTLTGLKQEIIKKTDLKGLDIEGLKNDNQAVEKMLEK